MPNTTITITRRDGTAITAEAATQGWWDLTRGATSTVSLRFDRTLPDDTELVIEDGETESFTSGTHHRQQATVDDGGTLTVDDPADLEIERTGLNALLRYVEVADRAQYGTGVNHVPWYRNNIPGGSGIRSLVLQFTPSGGLQDRGIEGVWGLVTGGEDLRNVPLTDYHVSLDVFVLAEASEYVDHDAIEADLAAWIHNMSTTIENDSTTIDDTDSPYLTKGEDIIGVNTTNGPVTVTLATDDVGAGRVIRIIDTGGNASTNNITVDTEGSETINPGSLTQLVLDVDGDYLTIFSEGTNWFNDKNRSVNQLALGNPTSLDNLASGPSDGTIVSKDADDNNRNLFLQMGDDTAGDGGPGYTANIQYITESGERIATTAADRVHNHWGVYTRGSAFNGTDEQPLKRMNIEGGSTVTNVFFENIGDIQVATNTAGSEAAHRLIPEDGDDAGYYWYQGSGNIAASIQYDASRDSLRLIKNDSTPSDQIEFNRDGNNEMDFFQHPTESVVWQSGTTANRPGSPVIGQRFFDTDLGQPIWFDGTDWVDAQGTVV